MGSIVLIADIVNSRDISNRRAFQTRLKATLDAVNAASASSLRSPYTITLGDEFQAVYRDFETVFPDLFHVLWRCHPHKVRFAVNADSIATDVNPHAALGMDGPAFHGARDAIEEAKRLDENVILVRHAGGPFDLLTEAALRVLSIYLDGLSATALGTLALYARGAGVATMVTETGVKERAVYKAMATHHVREYWQLFDEVRREINEKMQAEEEST